MHSMPPLNTPIDTNRRRFLAVAAGASAASVGTLTAAAEPVFDAALTELVAKFERLLDEYYALRRIWSPRLAQAHAETDELFGEIWNSDDKEARTKFFEQACARLNVRDAGDRMHAVGEEMKPLARAIVASPATSMEALRAKALVTLWEIAPSCAGRTHFDIDNEFAFQMLFSAVAEFCGLVPKVTATGYKLRKLPDLFDPCDEDDEDDEDDEEA
jgi:hypothetical protein